MSEKLERRIASLEKALEKQREENQRLKKSYKKIATVNGADLFVSSDVYDDAGILVLPDVGV